MSLEPEVIDAFRIFKRAKKLLEVERQRMLAMLPDDVATEFHYNGQNAVHRYPEYAEIFAELKR
jgi:hypothetical protein